MRDVIRQTLLTNTWRNNEVESGRPFIVVGSGSPTFEEPFQSDLCPLSEGDCVIDIDAKVADGILDVGVTKQDLYGPQVAGCFVDERSLCSAHRACSTRRR